MYIKINESNHITYASNCVFEDAIEIEDQLFASIPLEDMLAYQYYDGVLKLDEQIMIGIQQNRELFSLKQQRESECFSVINRGVLWYDTLTEEQLAELNIWYQAWLDVTETRVIPDKPDWIN